MIANIKLKDGQACGNSLISLSLCRQFCCIFNLVTLLLQVQINSFFFFFSSSLSLPDLFTHCFFQTCHKETALFRFSHSFLLTIWFSLLSKPVWLAYLTGDFFFFLKEKTISSRWHRTSSNWNPDPSAQVYPDYHIWPKHGASNRHLWRRLVV